MTNWRHVEESCCLRWYCNICWDVQMVPMKCQSVVPATCLLHDTLITVCGFMTHLSSFPNMHEISTYIDIFFNYWNVFWCDVARAREMLDYGEHGVTLSSLDLRKWRVQGVSFHYRIPFYQSPFCESLYIIVPVTIMWIPMYHCNGHHNVNPYVPL